MGCVSRLCTVTGMMRKIHQHMVSASATVLKGNECSFVHTPFRGQSVAYLLKTRESSAAGVTDLCVSSDNLTDPDALGGSGIKTR